MFGIYRTVLALLGPNVPSLGDANENMKYEGPQGGFYSVDPNEIGRAHV